jgi:hypothetical protein
MAMRDKDWEIDSLLKMSTEDKLVGCVKFLLQKSEERKKELRLSRQSSFMSQSDCRDFRVYFNEFVYFSVSKVL